MRADTASEQAAREASAERAAVRSDSVLIRVPFERLPGDRALLRLTKTRAERENGLLVDSLSGRWNVDARVLARRPRGYTIAWTYRPMRDSLAETRTPSFDLATNTLSGIPIVFRTDLRGQPYEIANADSLRAAIRRSLRRLAPRPGSERARLAESVRATAATDAGLESLLLADAERFHLLSGQRYPARRTVSTNSVLPNPFGGPAIPAVTRVRLVPDDSASTRATITWAQTPDAAALARILVDLLEEVSPDVPLTADEITRRFGIEEKATYRVGLGRGEIEAMRYGKTVRFGGRRRMSGLVIEREEPEQSRPAPRSDSREPSDGSRSGER